jgi:hypothetical protein
MRQRRETVEYPAAGLVVRALSESYPCSR